MKNYLIIVIAFLLCFISIYSLFQWPLALGTLAAWATTGSFFLQVLHIIKNRDTSGLSIGMWSALFFGVSCWSAYGVKLNDMPIFVANGITALMAFIVIALKLWNERPRKRDFTPRKIKRTPGVILRPRIRKARPLK